jgi:hypothetical protein
MRNHCFKALALFILMHRIRIGMVWEESSALPELWSLECPKPHIYAFHTVVRGRVDSPPETLELGHNN